MFTSQRFIIFLAGLIVYFLIIVTIPLRIKFIMNRTGKLLVKVQGKSIAMQILVIILSGLLIGLLLFRELGFFTDVVICFVGILGCAMGSEDAALNNKCGLYEKGIIGSGHFLPLSEIYALPALSYSKEEQDVLDPKVLMIMTDKKGVVNFSFSTAEEKREVENGLLALNSGLAR